MENTTEYRVIVEGYHEVQERDVHSTDENDWVTVCSGSLADCYAYIKLKEGGYL